MMCLPPNQLLNLKNRAIILNSNKHISKTNVKNDTLRIMLLKNALNRPSPNNSKTRYKITQSIGHLHGINKNVHNDLNCLSRYTNIARNANFTHIM